MNVREAARDPVAACDLSDGTLAVFERDNSETFLRGDAVAVER
jgi:hypothetical protein